MTTLDRLKGSNNTNKFNPQEPIVHKTEGPYRSNNTNKFNPQELKKSVFRVRLVQIIQINSILKN